VFTISFVAIVEGTIHLGTFVICTGDKTCWVWEIEATWAWGIVATGACEVETTGVWEEETTGGWEVETTGVWEDETTGVWEEDAYLTNLLDDVVDSLQRKGSKSTCFRAGMDYSDVILNKGKQADLRLMQANKLTCAWWKLGQTSWLALDANWGNQADLRLMQTGAWAKKLVPDVG
jgi:hypothetical protein